MGEGPTPERQDLRAIGVAALILCIGGGVWLDSQFGTTPMLTFVGIALGLAAAGYQLWELAKLGNTKARAGPVTRAISRLPMPRAARTPQGRSPEAPRRDARSNEE